MLFTKKLKLPNLNEYEITFGTFQIFFEGLPIFINQIIKYYTRGIATAIFWDSRITGQRSYPLYNITTNQKQLLVVKTLITNIINHKASSYQTTGKELAIKRHAYFELGRRKINTKNTGCTASQ